MVSLFGEDWSCLCHSLYYFLCQLHPKYPYYNPSLRSCHLADFSYCGVRVCVRERQTMDTKLCSIVQHHLGGEHSTLSLGAQHSVLLWPALFMLATWLDVLLALPPQGLLVWACHGRLAERHSGCTWLLLLCARSCRGKNSFEAPSSNLRFFLESFRLTLVPYSSLRPLYFPQLC